MEHTTNEEKVENLFFLGERRFYEIFLPKLRYFFNPDPTLEDFLRHELTTAFLDGYAYRENPASYEDLMKQNKELLTELEVDIKKVQKKSKLS